MNNIKDKIKHTWSIFKTEYWPDPVWSKVIAVGITTLLGSTLTALYIFIKSIYNNISFALVWNQVVEYFRGKTSVNNILLWILVLIVITSFFYFFKELFYKIIALIHSLKSRGNKIIQEFPVLYDHSTVFFASRLGDAFPGQRGLSWYEPKIAVQRFKILFRQPLRFRSVGHDVTGDPVWWFRGGSAVNIRKFKPLSKTKILLDYQEIELNRVAVFISDSYYKSFIYIEAKAEKQTGIYQYTAEDIQLRSNMYGYCREEYALFKKKPITREQFDDGSAIIKNKVVEISNAEIRVRYLTDYNFIIAAKQSPYNSKRFDRESNEMFKNLLNGSMKTEDFFEYLDTYRKNESLA